MCEKQEGVQLVCLSARAEDGMCANIYIKKSMAKPSIHEHERGGPNIGGEDRTRTRDEDARALHSNDWSPVSVKSTYASIYLFSGSSNDVPRDGKCQISAFNCVVLCCETILTTSN